MCCMCSGAHGHGHQLLGSSAGGFTVLTALARSDLFSAACSQSGVADLSRLGRTTHKFESHYVYTLAGATSDDDPVLTERSPLTHVERIHAPLLLLQGSEDPVVPPEQATQMHAALADQGLPVALIVFHGEGHGLRMAANIRRALDAELSFYSQVWDLPEHEGTRRDAVVVENLSE